MGSVDSNSAKKPPRWLGWVLSGLFLFALAMGVGPGVALVNPDPNSAEPVMLLGMPILYAWALIWCSVLIGIVLLANGLIWSREDEA